MSSDPWRPMSQPPPLLPDAVHVWRIPLQPLDQPPAPLRALLTPEELARADRLLRPEDRARFVLGRARLRQLLAGYLGLQPASVPLHTLPLGKPVLFSGGPEFNLSHSGNLALLAVSGSGPVGIDLEQIRPDLDWRPLARRFFHREEWQALTKLPWDQQQEAFFVVWTRKEAWLKALGTGLEYGTTDFAVTVPPAPPALAASGRASQPAIDCRFVDLPLEPHVTGTLVFAATPSLQDLKLSLLSLE